MPKKTRATAATKKTADILSAADELDLSEDTVRRDIRRGAPHERRKGKLYLNVPEYRAWREGKGFTGERGRPIEGDSPDLEKARLRKENALASKYELQVRRERGELSPNEDFLRWVSEHIGRFRNSLLGVGAAIAPMLQGQDSGEQQRLIDDAISEKLNELADAVPK